MRRRGFFVAVTAVLLLASSANAAPPLPPTGPLHGHWSCTCTSLLRVSAPPFTVSTFRVTQIGSAIQGYNTPTGNDPVSTFVGTYSSGMIMANLTCGAPRNSTGFIVGTLAGDGLSFDTIWLDSQGFYRVRGTKVP